MKVSKKFSSQKAKLNFKFLMLVWYLGIKMKWYIQYIADLQGVKNMWVGSVYKYIWRSFDCILEETQVYEKSPCYRQAFRHLLKYCQIWCHKFVFESR